MKPLAYGLLLGGLLSNRLAMAQSARAKLTVPENATLKIWEQQRQAVETAIYQRLVFPSVCLRDEVNGSVYIRLTIAPAGNVQQVAILKGLVVPFDQAVIKAARQLCFRPRSATAGAVSFGVGISFEKAVARLPTVGVHLHKLAPCRNSTP